MISSSFSIVVVLFLNIILLINDVSWIEAKEEENGEFQVNFSQIYAKLQKKPVGLLFCQNRKDESLPAEVWTSLSTFHSIVEFIQISSDETHYSSLTKSGVCSSTESTFVVFRNGKALTHSTIHLGAVYDVDSLFSNIYHIWLLHEIEYVNSVDQLNTVHRLCDEAKKLVVFFAAEAIGSPEHRRIGESIATIITDSRYEHLRHRLKIISTFETAILSHLNVDSHSSEFIVWDYSSSPPSINRYPVPAKDFEIRRFFKSILLPLPESWQQFEIEPYLQDGDLLFLFVFVKQTNRDTAATLIAAMKREGVAIVAVIVDVSVPLDAFYLTNGFSPQMADKTPYGAIYDMEKKRLEYFPLTAGNSNLNTVQQLVRMKMDDVNERRMKLLPVLSDETASMADIKTILTEDDQLVKHVMKQPIKRHGIRTLNESQFEEVLRKNEENVAVLFGVKWDAGTKLLLEAMGGDEESRSLVAYVDCYDCNRVCAKMDVFEYPKLIQLRTDGSHLELQSLVTPDNIKTVLQTANQPEKNNSDRSDMPEVMISNLAKLRNGGKQLLVLAVLENEADMARLKTTLAALQTEHRQVAWMNLNRAINLRVLMTLTGRVESPSFFLWDWERAAVFATTACDDMPKWLDEVAAGRIAETAPLNRRHHGPLLPAFNFVRMMEHEYGKMATPAMTNDSPLAGNVAPPDPMHTKMDGHDEL